MGVIVRVLPQFEGVVVVRFDLFVVHVATWERHES